VPQKASVCHKNQNDRLRGKGLPKFVQEPGQIKGLEIAAKSKLVRKGNTWYVPSQSNKQEKYLVALKDQKPECNCLDNEFRNT
jgi:hypothetical protein